MGSIETNVWRLIGRLGPIHRWPSHEILSLLDCNLTSLPSEVKNWINVTKIYFSHNAQKDKSYHAASHNNRLSFLPPEVSYWIELTEIYLAHVLLTHLPSEVSFWINLTRINLSFNQLTHLPHDVGYWTKLEFIDLSHNQLTSLPPEVSHWTNLKQIWLNDNQLTSLLPQVGYWLKLEKMELHKNNLTCLPPTIIKLIHLRRLTYLNNSDFIKIKNSVNMIKCMRRFTRGRFKFYLNEHIYKRRFNRLCQNSHYDRLVCDLITKYM